MGNACKQTNCEIALTGKCLESLNTQDCPHFYLLEDDSDMLSVDEVDKTGSSPSYMNGSQIKLFDGEPFGTKNLQILTYKYPCKAIYVLGDYSSGKTTLVATIFDLFQKGPIRNHLVFAESMTQLGFEKRCHLSRINSGGKKADTERTRLSEFKFLHVGLKEKGKEQLPAKHLLISDISGEVIEQSTDSSVQMGEMYLLRSAHKVVFMLDGAALASAKTRQSVIFNAWVFIKRAIDCTVLGQHTDLCMIISKYDYLIGQDEMIKRSIIDYFKEEFAEHLGAISFASIAARPNLDSGLNFGHGVYELLLDWLGPKKYCSAELQTSASVVSTSNRLFYQYHVVNTKNE